VLRADVHLKLGALFLWGSVLAPGQSGAAVGVWELRHPMPVKAQEVVGRAFRDAIGGNSEGLKTLRQSLADPEIGPYALKAAGALHLDGGQVQTALSELQEAVRLLPWDPQAQGFLSYALFTGGDVAAADKEARRALGIDSREPTANLTLALVKVDRIVENGGNLFDVLASDVPSRLRAAGKAYPGAWLILWSYYGDSDQPGAAARILSIYERIAPTLTAEMRARNEKWVREHKARIAKRTSSR
jgi:tetratricopeptide (TPR) repeat protein